VLNVDGGVVNPDTPASLITYPVQSGTPLDEIFYVIPSCPLDAILAHAAVSFPTFSGAQAQAYAYINQQFGLTQQNTDVRTQYPNLNSPLSAWMTALNEMPPAPGVSADDWRAVVTQLNTELTCAQTVQNLFNNYNSFHTQMFADQGARLIQLGL